MITCANCGTRNDDTAKFCIKCGKGLVAVAPQKPKRGRAGMLLAGGVLVGLLVTALSAGVVYHLLKPSLGPAAMVEATPEAPPLTSQGTTDQEGKAIIVDSKGSEQAIVRVKDEDSGLPVSGIEVYFMQRDSNYLAVAVDPEGRYLASWTQGSLEELGKSSSSLTTGRSFLPASPAYAQPLPLVVLFVKAVSKVSSLQDLIAFLQDPPNLVYWGVLYEDKCWTGEQLANYVGLAGLILPGIDEVAEILTGGMDDIAKAIFLLSQHVIEEDAKQSLSGLDRPVRIRTYHLGIPVLGMVPIGWCEGVAAATPTAMISPSLTPSVTTEPFRIASPTPEPMGPEFVISAGSLSEGYKYNPAISGNIVVWQDALCDCNWARDFSTGDEVLVSDYWGYQGRPAISGKFVVWADRRNGNSDIYAKNLATAEEFSIVADLADQESPTISGNIVVWQDMRNGNWDIYGKDLSTGREFPVTTEDADEWLPAVSGNIVVWFEGSQGWRIGNIWGKDISTSERFSIVGDRSADAKRPAVDGNIVAWVSYRFLDGWAILAKDISTGTDFQVTDYYLSSELSRPAVSGNLVIWGGTSGFIGDIYGRRLNVK